MLRGAPELADPFYLCDDLTIEVVDSAAGSRKTLTAVNVAIERAKMQGTKTMFCMPTLELIKEMVGVARRQTEVPIVEITSREDEEKAKKGKPRKYQTTAAVWRHITGKNEKGNPIEGHIETGHLLFITHETYYRMGCDWPITTREWEIVIDEVLEVILTRPLFLLHDNGWILSSFLDTVPVSVSPLARRRRAALTAKAREAGITIFTRRDAEKLAVAEKYIADGPERSSVGEVEGAKKLRADLLKKKANASEEQTDAGLGDLDELERSYCQVFPKLPPAYDEEYEDDPEQRAFAALDRPVIVSQWDQVYQILEPIPSWLLARSSLFVDWGGVAADD